MSPILLPVFNSPVAVIQFLIWYLKIFPCPTTLIPLLPAPPPYIVLLRFSPASSISIHSQACYIFTFVPAKFPAKALSLSHSGHLLLPATKARPLCTSLCWKLRLLVLPGLPLALGCHHHWHCGAGVLAPTTIPSLSSHLPEMALKCYDVLFSSTLCFTICVPCQGGCIGDNSGHEASFHLFPSSLMTWAILSQLGEKYLYCKAKVGVL